MANHAPVANTDTIWISDGPSGGTNIYFDYSMLLANDTDADGDQLTVDPNGFTNLIGVNNNGELLMTDTGDGRFVFPISSIGSVVGTDTTGNSFTYTIKDGYGGTAIGTVNVNVVHTSSSANTVNLATTGGTYDASYIDPQGGADVITGGSGNDTFVVSSGADTVNGNGGIDIISFINASAINITLTQSATPTTVSTANGGGLGITYSNIEGIFGSAFADTIIGSSSNDVLAGYNGSDTIRGGAGNDTLDGGYEAPGTSVNMLDMSDATAGLNFTLVQSSSFTTVDLTSAGLGVDKYKNFQGVIGSAFADTINGTSGNDTIVGGLGADTLKGFGGDDTFRYTIGDGADIIDGGDGNDTLAVLGTAGNDAINVVVAGGQITTGFGPTLTSIENISLDALGGTDTLSYAGTTQAVSVNLTTGAATGFTAIANVENVTGGDGNDTITIFGAAGNVIDGGAGTDTLAILGTSSADTITAIVANGAIASIGGGAITNVESFTLNMGNGTDTLSYAGTGSTQAITVNLATGSATGFASIASVENVTGGDGTDILTGSSAANVLIGGAGNDTITGGTGADTLTGGGGADTFIYASGDTSITIGGSAQNGTITGADIITDFVSSADFIDLVGIPTVAAATSGTDGADSTLRLTSTATTTIKSHAISANGLVTFSTAATFSATALTTTGGVAAALQYLERNSIGTGAAVVFNATISGVAHTYVYQQVGASPSAANDIFIDLQGVTITDLRTLITNGHIDPIVLDLGGEGIHFTSVQDGVQFDLNANGVHEQVAWTSGHEGILALDVNHNGTIDDGSEIFSPFFAGGSFADGLAALASLDTNGDGKIDASDDAYSQLQIWQDLNHDGISDPGELSGLADLGIKSIALDAEEANDEIDGQTVTANGTFMKNDGTTGHFVEVTFDTASSVSPPPVPAVSNSFTIQTPANAPPESFDFTNLTHSLGNDAATIDNFHSGVDTIHIGHDLAGLTTGLAIAGTGDLAADLMAVLTNGNLLANGAAEVTINGGSNAGTYAVVNDGTAGFNVANDAVFKLTNAALLHTSDFII